MSTESTSAAVAASEAQAVPGPARVASCRRRLGRDFPGGGATVGLAYYATDKLTNDHLGPVASVLVRGKNVSTASGPRPRPDCREEDRLRMNK
jgi:hypothetical protein